MTSELIQPLQHPQEQQQQQQQPHNQPPVRSEATRVVVSTMPMPVGEQQYYTGDSNNHYQHPAVYQSQSHQQKQYVPATGKNKSSRRAIPRIMIAITWQAAYGCASAAFC